MTDLPRRVFLSHSRELREYPHGLSFVGAAERAVIRAGDSVSDMDYFPVRDDQPADYCIKAVGECDVYVGIIGFRYGSSVRDRPEMSYTQLEFQTATENKKPRLVFLLDEEAEVPVRLATDVAERMEWQRTFREELRGAGILVGTFRNPEDLQMQLYQALLELRRQPPPSAPPKSMEPAPRISYSHLDFDRELHAEDGQELFSVAFSPNGELVAAGAEQCILMWGREEHDRPTAVIGGHDSYVYSVAFGDQGSMIASGGQDGVVRVFDVATGQLRWEQHHGEAVYSVAFSPDGRRLASGGYDRQAMLWDAHTGEFQRSPSRHGGRITSVAFDPSSRWLAIGSLDDTVTVWDVRTGQSPVLRGHHSSVESVAFSPNREQLLLASTGLDKQVIVWAWNGDTFEMKWAGREHEYLVRSVAFSPDGATVATASWDKTLRLWDTETGECTRALPWDAKNLPWHSDWIWSVAFSPNGMELASGGSDGKLLLWRVRPAENPT